MVPEVRLALRCSAALMLNLREVRQDLGVNPDEFILEEDLVRMQWAVTMQQ